MNNEIAPPLPHPFADLVGFEVTGLGHGTCTSRLTVNESHMNPHGVVHGAVVYALADTGMGGALSSVLDENQICSTIEIKINYFRPAIGGEITCDTQVVNRGSRTGVLQSTVKDDKDRLIAQAMGTFMILPKPGTSA